MGYSYKNGDNILYDDKVTYVNGGPTIFKSKDQTHDDVENYLNTNIRGWDTLGKDEEGFVAWKHYNKAEKCSPQKKDIYSPFKKFYDNPGNISEAERVELARMNE